MGHRDQGRQCITIFRVLWRLCADRLWGNSKQIWPPKGGKWAAGRDAGDGEARRATTGKRSRSLLAGLGDDVGSMRATSYLGRYAMMFELHSFRNVDGTQDGYKLRCGAIVYHAFQYVM